jgi:hypothetical protein
MKDYSDIIDKTMVSNCCGAIPTSPLCEHNTGFCSACKEGAAFSSDEDEDEDSSFYMPNGHITEDWEDNNTDTFGQCFSDSEF